MRFLPRVNREEQPVNYKYLLDFTNGKPSIITISKYTDGHVVFEYGNTPKVLIMPMQADWGDKPVAPPVEPAVAVEAEGQPTNEVAEEEEETDSSGEEESGAEAVEETAETEKLSPVPAGLGLG